MRVACILAMLAIGAWVVQADAAWLQKKSDNEEDQQVATSREEVRFPKDFFVDEIRGEACHHHPSTYNFDWQWKYISELSAIDGARFNEDGTSLSVKHGELSKRWANLLDLTYDAAATGDAAKARRMVELLVHLAEEETLFSLPKLSELKKGKCWKGGNTKAKCPTHTTEHGSHYFTAYVYAAIVLREYLSDSEEALLDGYIERSYRDYIRPVAQMLAKGSRFYAFAHNGLGILAYANWSNDARLAKSEIRRTAKLISRLVNKKGYIDNNSYRGVRAYWYHTSGVDNVLGYAVVAREHGVDLFKDRKVGPKLKALADATLEGGVNLEKFMSKGNRGTKYSKNYSTDPKDARPHMHQTAVSLPLFLIREFGVDVPTAPKYDRLVRYETVDRFVGFNAECYYASRKHSGQESAGEG